MLRFLFTAFCALCWYAGYASPFYSFNTQCSQSYQQVLAMRVAQARQMAAIEKQTNPENLVPYFLDNYADFMELFFNEDKKQYLQMVRLKDERLTKLASGPKTSPLHLFTQAVVHLQWAAVEMKFDNRWAGAMAFREAYKLAHLNQRRFPNFMPNYMITGPMEMVAATIPKNLQWLSNLMGISGTMQGGNTSLQRFLKSGDDWSRLFMQEGIFYHTYLQFHIMNRPNEALAFIRQQKLDVVNNHLFAYMAANLSLNNQQAETCERIVRSRNLHSGYLKTPVWDFLLGYANLYKLDAEAEDHFENFLDAFKGNYYVKDAWLKLGYHYLVRGNNSKFQYCQQQVKRHGNTASDADKRALREASEAIVPNTLLLKARLLSDGGYYSRALTTLKQADERAFTNSDEMLEYNYRLGRIYQDMKDYEKAISQFEKVMRDGNTTKTYFAGKAALEAGEIKELNGDKAAAIRYYNRCIAYRNHDYENALEQKARAGIVRCTGG